MSNDPERLAQLAYGLSLLKATLDGEGPQSTRMVFDLAPGVVTALQGIEPADHVKVSVLALLDEAADVLKTMSGSIERPTLPKGDLANPLLPSLQLRVAEWLGRAAPLVRTECDSAELTITLHTPQSCDDDDTLWLEARLEEKATHAEISGALPGIKHR